MVASAGPIHVDGNKLVFEKPQEIDSGNYTFIINNTAGEKKKSVWIMISGELTLFITFVVRIRAGSGYEVS